MVIVYRICRGRPLKLALGFSDLEIHQILLKSPFQECSFVPRVNQEYKQYVQSNKNILRQTQIESLLSLSWAWHVHSQPMVIFQEALQLMVEFFQSL